MCSICGVYNSKIKRSQLEKMSKLMFHRGPDGGGVFTDDNIGLGMQRLAIIDLSSDGYQPMPNEDKTIWIVFNGEIYNHLELRKELEKEGHRYRSSSDTESILHLYEEHGEDCIQKLRGMFAFALWDSKKKELLLAVDRLGIKPLYYTSVNGSLVFASELKAILQYEPVKREIDFSALDEYLKFLCVPAPKTMIKGIHKLLPGHMLVIKDGETEIKRYWDLHFEPNYSYSEERWTDEIYHLLRESVRMHLMSDVPFGAFLSGGMDSSSIVALMSDMTGEPVETFTVGFQAQEHNYHIYDETRISRIVADYYHTNHHEFIIEPKVMNILPEIIWHFDEPFANITAIPMYFISNLARQHVTVALGGVGGDESFGGYPRYIAAKFLDNYFKIPYGIREHLLKRVANVLPQKTSDYAFFNRAVKFISGTCVDPVVTYKNWQSFFSEDVKRKLYLESTKQQLIHQQDNSIFDFYLKETDDWSLLNKIFFIDIKTYLPNDLLTYSDRMSMANSLELRVPFCDHKIVELAATIPPEMKMKGFTLKRLLKKAMSGILPEEVVNKRKQGFSVPIGNWLQNDLLRLARRILSKPRVEERGYFNSKAIDQMLNEHCKGLSNHTHRLWALIIFDIWHTMYIDQNEISKPTFSLTDLI